MRREDDDGSASSPGSLRDHVAYRVDAHVAKPERFEPLLHLGGAPFFLERGCRDLADGDLLFDGPRVVGAEPIEGGADCRVPCGFRLGVECGRKCERKRQRERGAKCHWTEAMSEAMAAGLRPVASASDRSMRALDRKSTRLNSSHSQISYAVFC